MELTGLRGALYVLTKVRVAFVFNSEKAAAVIGAGRDALWEVDDQYVEGARQGLKNLVRLEIDRGQLFSE